ncbi:MAG: Pyrophosphate--fructose 6-phosphate 1-phosphotransferase [Candidatus Omnitrophica bacterium ADurb.Bin277]|nr:MAG: Pyrophosphate--fructose 6-phosphate 1-phosphotransferase [Candidatus Omnitrophica bacterium ADurb.Bin277]
MTAGGDCPGLNAVIRAATKTAILAYGWKVFGIEDGYAGLIEGRGHELTTEMVSGILTQGGTILGTSNRANPFKTPVIEGKRVRYVDLSKQAIRNFRKWGLDVLVAVGGDGTLKIASLLVKRGIPVIGIPKTIDNDLSGTDFTFGFDTAVSIATDAIDRLHTTAAAHHRVMILEVMGRHAGWIALHAGSAGGADVILIPEIPYSMQCVRDMVMKRANYGKKFSLICVAEGAKEKGGRVVVRARDLTNPYPEKLGGVGEYLASKIEKMCGLETRAAKLGHIQRGGSPTPFDRNLGTLFGAHAIELVSEARFGEMVCLQGTKVESLPISEAVRKLKTVPTDHPLVLAGESIGICFGR